MPYPTPNVGDDDVIVPVDVIAPVDVTPTPVINPVDAIDPITSSFVAGVGVPIPTFPAVSTINGVVSVVSSSTRSGTPAPDWVILTMSLAVELAT